MLGRPGQASGMTPDVARLMGQPQQREQYGGPPPGTYAAPPSATGQTPDIQQLLANLTNYKPPS